MTIMILQKRYRLVFFVLAVTVLIFGITYWTGTQQVETVAVDSAGLLTQRVALQLSQAFQDPIKQASGISFASSHTPTVRGEFINNYQDQVYKRTESIYNATFFQTEMNSILAAMKVTNFDMMFVDKGFEDKTYFSCLQGSEVLECTCTADFMHSDGVFRRASLLFFYNQTDWTQLPWKTAQTLSLYKEMYETGPCYWEAPEGVDCSLTKSWKEATYGWLYDSYDPTGRPWYVEGVRGDGGIKWIPPYLSYTPTRLVMDLTYAIYSPGGMFRGVGSFSLSLESFDTKVKALSLDGFATAADREKVIYVYNGEGVVLASNSRNEHRFVKLLTLEKDGPLENITIPHKGCVVSDPDAAKYQMVCSALVTNESFSPELAQLAREGHLFSTKFKTSKLNLAGKDFFVSQTKVVEDAGNLKIYAVVMISAQAFTTNTWLLIGPMLGGLVLFFFIVVLYTHFQQNHNDHIWKISFKDLQFEDPPEVLGNGTFGVVIKAQYHGTDVAVKRVMPPNQTASIVAANIQGLRRRSSFIKIWTREWGNKGTHHRSRESLFDFQAEGVTMTETNHVALEESPPQMQRAMSTSLHSSPSLFVEAKNMTSPLSPLPKRESIMSDSPIPSPLTALHAPLNGRANGIRASLYPASSFLAKSTSQIFLSRVSGHSASDGTSSLQGVWAWGPIRRVLDMFRDPVQHRQKRLERDFLRDIRLLAGLRHPCIISVMGAVLERSREPMLVMECMDHGSLFDIIHNRTLVLDADLVLSIMRDVIQGIVFLHKSSPPIIHGDIKSGNILLDKNFKAKVSDFGLTQKKKLGITGTPYWMAPELLVGEPNTSATDMYAFGITLWEIYSRKQPYEGLDRLKALQDVVAGLRPPIPAETPHEISSLMINCWHTVIAMRPDAQEVSNIIKNLESQNVSVPKQMRTMQMSKIEQGHDNRDELLYSIFPRHIADTLKSGGKVEPEAHPIVSIFFSDIVGFTDLASTMDPMKISNMLDRLYVCFDGLVKEYDVFKVETIGDAYMATTNVVKLQPDHVIRLCRFSLAVMEAASKVLIDESNPGLGTIKIRVGIHCGPVVSNVVGISNPRYCLFGDSVNTASRMESNSLPGMIQISEQTRNLIYKSWNEQPSSKDFEVRQRGIIEVKGKGRMKTFWVLRPVDNPALSQAEPLPPERCKSASSLQFDV